MRTVRLLTVFCILGAGTAVGAQEPPPTLMLTCAGTEKEIQQTGSTSTVTVTPGTDPGIGGAAHRAAVIAQTATTRTTSSPTYGEVRVPARMSIAVAGGAIRVRPPENNRPGLGQKKSADGWYEMGEVEIAETQIRARAPYGGILSGKLRLTVDRQTGDARYGDFTGVCEKAETAPTERKF
ncbi:hypothetical protein [Phenylobacterium sp. J367]|uniref:hypothetical protein n=1 Tax=Phenylobacterium sp. J367 TaxID=2898435 RepID=UPI002150E613|nr:hypothetical protein [Phenylobacterium sp. J367]MCR5879441.1 hypothetical protein [Phenylobacterium sp. J367]